MDTAKSSFMAAVVATTTGSKLEKNVKQFANDSENQRERIEI